MSETDLSRAIVKALLLLPSVVSVTRVQSGKVGGYRVHLAPEGTPDILVCLRAGRTIWLEVKTDTGMLSEAQAKWHLHHLRYGHRVEVVRSVVEAVNLVMGRKVAS